MGEEALMLLSGKQGWRLWMGQMPAGAGVCWKGQTWKAAAAGAEVGYPTAGASAAEAWTAVAEWGPAAVAGT